MKKIASGILALMIGIAALQAQEKNEKAPPPPSQMHQKHPGKPGMRGRHDMDFKKLNLTTEQQSQMKKIHEDFKGKMDNLEKSEATITLKDYREKKKVFETQRHDQIQNVLTREQKDQLAKMHSERGRKFDGGPRRGMDRMKAELGLSDEQSAQIKTLQEDTKAKMKSIRENQSLSEDEKKQQIMVAFKNQREGINKILTPEQQKKMESMRPKHMNRETK
ncbi:MAG: hypothetical protein IT249_02290 [Chitinophagaceae bacterium]|nr:hypothetical protein [Chitinophagaceae bacterium]